MHAKAASHAQLWLDADRHAGIPHPTVAVRCTFRVHTIGEERVVGSRIKAGLVA
jgi:hypothetical protein